MNLVIEIQMFKIIEIIFNSLIAPAILINKLYLAIHYHSVSEYRGKFIELHRHNICG